MAQVSRRKLASYIADQLTAGADRGQLLAAVASYLIEHRQTGQLELLVRDVEVILSREHGIVLAQIVSARELSAELTKKITRFVADSENASQVEVNTSIDPSLLGGVIIRTPRAQLDASVRRQLNDLKV